VHPVLPALLDRCRFPGAGTPVTCAVSGGADSLALLALAVAAGCEVTAVHVDHGLRSGSAAEAERVADAAARFGAAFRSCRVAVEPGPNLEARARTARYAALPRDVCTGHTADDQAETVLLQLLRGGGLAGFAAMRAGTRRPLLALRRHETRALCASLALEPFDDPMNADPGFTRVRVRQEVVPLLDDVARRDVAPLLARNAELAADALDALDATTSQVDATDTLALRALPRPLARWAVRRWLTAQTGSGYAPDAGAIDRVLAVVDGTVRAAEISGGWRVARTGNRLRVEGVRS
jgi:tRNA(Ile)-lysidine synthase